MKFKMLTGPALAAIATIAAAGSATAQSGVKAGVLSCELTGKTNAILYSNETFSCVYNPNQGGNEQYDGSISRIGVDLEWKVNQQLIWFVLAPTSDIQGGALAGRYVGASASAGVGGGVGAKVLIGGFEKSIQLQPISVAGSEAVGAAVGIEELELTAK